MYTWLFSENLSKTKNNNSWYFFEHIAETASNDNIDAYFILVRSKENVAALRGIDRSLRRRIIWRNSLRHHVLYWKADMFFVTLSYKDVLPDIYRGKHKNLQPVNYLQHGTCGIKKIDYTGGMYWNSLFKFMVYGPNEKNLLIQNNDFAEYQLKYSNAHPRYKELLRIDEENKEKDQILWFLTWRDYISGGLASQDEFASRIKEVLLDDSLQEYLRANSRKLRVVLHQHFTRSAYTDIVNALPPTISVVHADSVDVMMEMAKSYLLITDYSSLGFDFTFLGRPVLTYQFDYLVYETKREFYCDLRNDFKNNRYVKRQQLIDAIVGQAYDDKNKFFLSNLEKLSKSAIEGIKRGVHIDNMYDYFKDAQSKKAVLIGYNFFGRGGTVSATKSLAEGLAEKGYIVELVSLKRINLRSSFPKGVIVRSFMNYWRSPVESLKYHLFKGGKTKGYLNDDINGNLLIPYVGYALRRYLKNTKAQTVISTRESIHLFLSDVNNVNIKNKLFFFHTAPNVVNQLYPGVINRLQERGLGAALFVTENTRLDYAKELGFDNYRNYAITGNALSSSDMVSENEIESVGKKMIYEGIVLTRLSKDRSKDLQNIIEFGIILKKRGVDNIKIGVYGAGDAVYGFCEKIMESGVDDIIFYRGMTITPQDEIRAHDFLVDFSESHSFGMIYIEAILNGVMCYARDNSGSREVLRGVDDVIYNDFEELLEFISRLHMVERKDLLRNYRTIAKRYSRLKVVSELESVLEG